MKMNVLRHLVLPWLLLFAVIIGVIVATGVKFHLDPKYEHYALYFLGVGVFFCLFSNFGTISKAGIWIAHSLPSSLRRSPWGWLLRAFIAALVALLFYGVGQLAWIPLIWQAAVIPAVFALCLFVGIWSLMGPILTWSSQLAFSRFSAFMMSLPVFVLVPVTAIFLGEMIVVAYHASRPDFVMIPKVSATVTDATPETTSDDSSDAKKTEIVAKDKQALGLQEAAQSGQPCPEKSKEIQNALTSNGADDVVYWALAALKCTEMKSVVGLPKLAKIMTDHKNPLVRAKALRAMSKFPREDVKRIGYLIVKRITEHEPVEVIEAASVVLVKLGEDEAKWATKRLTALLDSNKASAVASKVLVKDLKREDQVAEYVSSHLADNNSAASRGRAISMICSLTPESRKIAEPHIEAVVASIKTGDQNDPAIDALECLGHPGYQAIRQEVLEPKRLEKPVAARVLAEMDVKTVEPKDALETATSCAHDKDQEVRKWCSQTLGQIGALALPQILDLLKSNDKDLKEAGTNALNFFKDPVAKQELVKVRAENSGWMANQKKLQIAKAVDKALIKIMSEEAQAPADGGGAPGPSSSSPDAAQ